MDAAPADVVVGLVGEGYLADCAVWPGEEAAAPVEETPIGDRDEDFVRFVIDEVNKRQKAEDAFYAGVDPQTGEVR